MAMSFDLTVPHGRSASIKRWWCRRRGHRLVPASVAGYWSPSPGRVREQFLVGTGTMCDRCNTWADEPYWPYPVHPSLVRDLQLHVGSVGWTDDVGRRFLQPATRHR